jgi:hypothetical protein
VIALAAAGGLIGLGTDAGVSHFAARSAAHPAQFVPVIVAPLAAALLVAFVGAEESMFRRAMRAIGGVVALVGAIGTWFHLRSFLMLLLSAPFDWSSVEAALAAAPPLFAPGGFLAIGLVVAVLGSLRIELRGLSAHPRPLM